MNKKECIRLYEEGKKLHSEDRFKEAIIIFNSIDIKMVGNFEESIIHHFKGVKSIKI